MHIGQEIIAIVDHEQGAFKKGDSFIVKDISEVCGCGLVVDIGMKDEIHPTHIVMCPSCNKETTNDGIWWFRISRFVPVNYNTAKRVTFTEIVEDVPVFAN